MKTLVEVIRSKTNVDTDILNAVEQCEAALKRQKKMARVAAKAAVASGKNGRPRISERKRRAIRESTLSAGMAAAKYHVSITTVRTIRAETDEAGEAV